MKSLNLMSENNINWRLKNYIRILISKNSVSSSRKWEERGSMRRKFNEEDWKNFKEGGRLIIMADESEAEAKRYIVSSANINMININLVNGEKLLKTIKEIVDRRDQNKNVGVWLGDKHGVVYIYGVTRYDDIEDAIEIALKRNKKYIYDSETEEVISVDDINNGGAIISNGYEKHDGFICVLCNKNIEDQYGNNPAPFASEGKACDECDESKVIPARMGEYHKK